MRSRRSILKIGAAATLALAARRWSPRRARAQDDEPPYDPGGRIRIEYDETLSFNELYDYPPLLGRVEGWRLRVATSPDRYDDVVREIRYDDVLPIYQAIHADPPYPFFHNDVWYDVGDGFVHSSYIVPVHEVFNEPEDPTGEEFWGEISVPTSWQHTRPKLRSQRYYDLAYGTVYRVVDRQDEEDGRAWYRLIDDANAQHTEWWVQAAHVRRIQEEEFEPISPDVPPEDKLIHVDIGEQTLTCYEADTVVFRTRIASGTTFVDDEGEVHAFHTPYGEHKVFSKMPSRHMIGGESINDSFDLPGVPWCTFFTGKGAAIHGTYWHNDYGRPRSHGCINVTNDAAKWVYRWVNPYTGESEDYHRTDDDERESATQIIVE